MVTFVFLNLPTEYPPELGAELGCRALGVISPFRE